MSTKTNLANTSRVLPMQQNRLRMRRLLRSGRVHQQLCVGHILCATKQHRPRMHWRHQNLLQNKGIQKSRFWCLCWRPSSSFSFCSLSWELPWPLQAQDQGFAHCLSFSRLHSCCCWLCFVCFHVSLLPEQASL